MREWHGARPVGQACGWLLLLTAVVPADGGCWHYVYSFRPGRLATIVVMPGPDMLPPYDDTYASIVAGLAAAWPASA